MLGERVRRTLTLFFYIASQLHQKKYTIEEIEYLINAINEVLALFERDCPLWLFDITTHILRHVAEKIKPNGPIYASWMYPYERMNSWLTRRVMNRKNPEACIMETYQVYPFSFHV